MHRAGKQATAIGVIVVTAATALACGRLASVRGRAGHEAVRERISRHAVREALTALVENRTPPVFVGTDRQGRELWQLTRTFYRKHEHAPAWFDGATPRPKMKALLDQLQHADRNGLEPALYGASILTDHHARAVRVDLDSMHDPADPAALDAWLTYSYLQYASDLATGVARRDSDADWNIRGSAFDPVATLEDALARGRVADSLEDLAPHDPQYRALTSALARYREIAADGGWPALPASLRLKPGDEDARVPDLARRLAITGDYTEDPSRIADTATVYGPALQGAVRRFQQRHGLEPDGVVGPAAIAAMNVPASERVRQIELNLERWRWLPRDLGDRYIFVNVPEYRLEVRDHGAVPVSMRVVVGKADTPTPIFADEMSYLVFAPYWNIPTDIVERETLPSILHDPRYLQRQNMEIVDRDGNPVDPAAVDAANPGAYRFRQRPGASNSLGLVKFMFPNQYNVYLHDTPADSLFARATRSFSHGCVRLEHPEQLAEYVLQDQPDWTAARIAEAMRGADETTVRLREKLPVYIVYFTARVSADGQVQFRQDLYGVDGRQGSRMTKSLARTQARAAVAAQALRTEGGLVQVAF